VAIAGSGFTREIEGQVPEHLRKWWTDECWCLHSAAWWRRHWERTGILDIEQADNMPDGWQRWLDWQRMVAPDNAVEIEALEVDRGNYFGFVRVVGVVEAMSRWQTRLCPCPRSTRGGPCSETRSRNHVGWTFLSVVWPISRT